MSVDIGRLVQVPTASTVAYLPPNRFNRAGEWQEE